MGGAGRYNEEEGDEGGGDSFHEVLASLNLEWETENCRAGDRFMHNLRHIESRGKSAHYDFRSDWLYARSRAGSTCQMDRTAG